MVQKNSIFTNRCTSISLDLRFWIFNFWLFSRSMEYIYHVDSHGSTPNSLANTELGERSPFTALRRGTLGYETHTILTYSRPRKTYPDMEKIRIDNFPLLIPKIVSLHKRITSLTYFLRKLTSNQFLIICTTI